MNCVNCSREKEDFFDFLGDLNLAVIYIKENIENRNLEEIYPEMYKVQDKTILSKGRPVKLV